MNGLILALALLPGGLGPRGCVPVGTMQSSQRLTWTVTTPGVEWALWRGGEQVGGYNLTQRTYRKLEFGRWSQPIIVGPDELDPLPPLPR